MFETTIVSSLNEVVTVPVVRGYRNTMRDRIQWGLSFCEGEGKILYHHDGQAYLSDRDHAVWLPMGATYLLDCRESGYFPLINMHCVTPAFPGFASIPLRQVEPLLRLYEVVKEKFLFRRSPAGALSALYDIFATLAAEEPHGEADLLAPALLYLEKNYADPTLQNDRLAACISVSEAYFRRLFKNTYRTTPRQYLLDLRIKHAKEYLLSGVTTVSRVAELCGFSGVYHFCRAFRQATGQTPTEYRRRHAPMRI